MQQEILTMHHHLGAVERAGAILKPRLEFFTFVYNAVIEHDRSDQTQAGLREIRKDTQK